MISIKDIHLKNLQSFINPLKMIISKIIQKEKNEEKFNDTISYKYKFYNNYNKDINRNNIILWNISPNEVFY